MGGREAKPGVVDQHVFFKARGQTGWFIRVQTDITCESRSDGGSRALHTLLWRLELRFGRKSNTAAHDQRSLLTFSRRQPNAASPWLVQSNTAG